MENQYWHGIIIAVCLFHFGMYMQNYDYGCDIKMSTHDNIDFSFCFFFQKNNNKCLSKTIFILRVLFMFLWGAIFLGIWWYFRSHVIYNFGIKNLMNFWRFVSNWNLFFGFISVVCENTRLTHFLSLFYLVRKIVWECVICLITHSNVIWFSNEYSYWNVLVKSGEAFEKKKKI